ncbi:winged helix-turn-helix domain-containing protein [Spirillospora sp. NPDC052269]
MALRIVFQREDLQRLRIAASADPMWELVLSAHHARLRRPPSRYLSWRQELGERASRSGVLCGRLGPFWELVPVRGDFPDFLTPSAAVSDIDAGCAALATTSRRRLGRDLAAAFSGGTVSTWARSLAAGDRRQVSALVEAVRGGYELLVSPWWHHVQAAVRADRAVRMEQTADRGLASMLSGLPGVVGWDGRVLETDYPEQRTIELNGRGITLIPSYFCWGPPVALIDGELPPVLVYSATPERGRPLGTPPEALVTLLGGTRARCLHALLRPRTTSVLAASVGVTPGAASKHATALREAGLITSSRDGASVVHHVSELGASLLAQDRPAR